MLELENASELYNKKMYSILEGPKYEVEFFKKKPIDSPLLQGGLEIPIKVSVTLDSPENLSISGKIPSTFPTGRFLI